MSALADRGGERSCRRAVRKLWGTSPPLCLLRRHLPLKAGEGREGTNDLTLLSFIYAAPRRAARPPRRRPDDGAVASALGVTPGAAGV